MKALVKKTLVLKALVKNTLVLEALVKKILVMKILDLSGHSNKYAVVNR